MAVLLDHDDVERLLHELARRLHAAGVTAGIRIVGGAAIALMNSDRRSTADIEYLLDRCNVTSVDDAQEIYERYHAQDVLTNSAIARVQAWLDAN